MNSEVLQAARVSLTEPCVALLSDMNVSERFNDNFIVRFLQLLSFVY